MLDYQINAEKSIGSLSGAPTHTKYTVVTFRPVHGKKIQNISIFHISPWVVLTRT